MVLQHWNRSVSRLIIYILNIAENLNISKKQTCSCLLLLGDRSTNAVTSFTSYNRFSLGKDTFHLSPSCILFCFNTNLLSGTWNDINCGSVEMFICERLNNTVRPTIAPTSPPPKGGCTEDWLLFDNKVQHEMLIYCIFKRAECKIYLNQFFSCSRVFLAIKNLFCLYVLKDLKITNPETEITASVGSTAVMRRSWDIKISYSNSTWGKLLTYLWKHKTLAKMYVLIYCTEFTWLSHAAWILTHPLPTVQWLWSLQGTFPWANLSDFSRTKQFKAFK